MYKDFFGFSEEPFNLTPDPTFLYMTRSHWETFSAMMEGVRERKGIMVITGDVGTGKTTLVHALLKDLSDKIKTAFIFNPRLTFKQLLKAILKELDVYVGGQNTLTLLYKFDEYIRERSAADETVVILIDEAQVMTPAVLVNLDKLLQRDAAQTKVLQTLLVGQLELEAHLDSEELRQFKSRIAVQGEIRPLNREETEAYIDHRLKKVGGSSAGIFTPPALRLICDAAKGIPRVINLICDGALFAGYNNTSREIGVKQVWESLVENDIITGRGDLRTAELREEKESLHGEEISAGVERPAPKQEVQAPEVKNTQPSQVEKEAPSEEKPALGKRVGEEREASEQREIKAEKEIMEEMDLPRPQEAEALRPDRSFQKKIGISVLVVSALAVMAFIYLYERESFYPKGREGILSPPQEQREKGVQGGIPEKKEWKGITVKVEEGWNLALLAKRHYGSTNPTLIDLILEANPQITDLNLIQVNQTIKIPGIEKDLFLSPASPQGFRIHLGTFADQSAVRIFQDETLLGGKRLEILPRKVSSQETWYRIFAGEFKNKEEAVQMIQALRRKGLLPAFPRLAKAQ